MLKLGPLIGKRTWGGVIGIWPRHRLVDGTVTTQPEFSFFFDDVGWRVENYGTDPTDIEVDNAPQDYAAGRDPQLERGIEEALRLIETAASHGPRLARVRRARRLRSLTVLPTETSAIDLSPRLEPGILGLTTAHPASWASLTPPCRGPKPPPQASISAGPAVCGQDRT